MLIEPLQQTKKKKAKDRKSSLDEGQHWYQQQEYSLLSAVRQP
jgi:hypothetical protein